MPAEGAGGVGGTAEEAEGGRVLARHLEEQALLLRLLPGEEAQWSSPLLGGRGGAPRPGPVPLPLTRTLLHLGEGEKWDRVLVLYYGVLSGGLH